jgi:hypothetical protein
VQVRAAAVEALPVVRIPPAVITLQRILRERRQHLMALPALHIVDNGGDTAVRDTAGDRGTLRVAVVKE